jgi:hypothetical protein
VTWPVFRDAYLREIWIVYLCALAVALALLPGATRTMRWLTNLARPILRFDALLPVIAATFAFVLGLIPTLYHWTAPPAVHDEVSYLLAADTFLHGRLSNPTPVMWKHFQTMHELMVPTYASKFPPGQGIALAVGSLLGSPRVGAFGAVALGVAATCWMMRTVLPAGWALAGSLLAAVMPTIYFWGQNFWGGGIAMIGGALLAGTVLRAMRHDRAPTDRVIDGIVIGIGAATLMNSRPFEGALLSLLLALWLLIAARSSLRQIFWSAPGAVIVLLPVLVWMGYYNYRVTHHALRLPYAEHAARYMHSPIFYWQKPQLDNDSGVAHLEAFFREFERPEWQAQTTLRGWLFGFARKMSFVVADAFRPILLLPAVLIGGGLAIWRRRGGALLAATICVGLLLLHLLVTPWLRFQYLGVIAPLFVLWVTISLRELDALWRARPIGSAVMLIMVVSLPIWCLHAAWAGTRDPSLIGRGRQHIIDVAESQPGNHIIFVQYPDGPQSVYEWVYNGADIDSQRVIWVHALDAASNTALAEHYSDRSIWVLTAKGDDYTATLEVRKTPQPAKQP